MNSWSILERTSSNVAGEQGGWVAGVTQQYLASLIWLVDFEITDGGKGSGVENERQHWKWIISLIGEKELRYKHSTQIRLICGIYSSLPYVHVCF